MASRRDSEASSASEASAIHSEASTYSSRSSSPTPSSWGRRSSVLADLLSNENTDSPVELICIPGVGGSRLMRPDERGVDQEVYPALWECIKGRAKPSERMIRKQGDGSYASEVLCRIAHIPNWVPLLQLKKLGAAETHMWAYDWRRDVSELGPLFLTWLLELKAQRPSDTRFIILAHSYGGLVTVDALSLLQDSNLIAGVITFGSPFHGTYKVHTVRRQGFSIFNWISVYTPETYQSFAALWLITPGCNALRAWRNRIVKRDSTVLANTRFVCVTGKADTLNTEAEDVVDGLPPAMALGDGTVTVDSATDPPGVKPIAKLVSENHHVILANCETSITDALRLIIPGKELVQEKLDDAIFEKPVRWSSQPSLFARLWGIFDFRITRAHAE